MRPPSPPGRRAGGRGGGALAKRDLKPGDMLDAHRRSVHVLRGNRCGAKWRRVFWPMGLAENVRVISPVKAGEPVPLSAVNSIRIQPGRAIARGTGPVGCGNKGDPLPGILRSQPCRRKLFGKKYETARDFQRVPAIECSRVHACALPVQCPQKRGGRRAYVDHLRVARHGGNRIHGARQPCRTGTGATCRTCSPLSGNFHRMRSC